MACPFRKKRCPKNIFVMKNTSKVILCKADKKENRKYRKLVILLRKMWKIKLIFL